MLLSNIAHLYRLSYREIRTMILIVRKVQSISLKGSGFRLAVGGTVLSENNGRTATREEVLHAAENLSDAEFLRLRQFGTRLIYGTVYTGEDIVQQALVGVISMNRRWPVEIPFLVFLKNAMKSIASNDRTCLRAKSEVVAAELANEMVSDTDELLANLAPISEECGLDEQLITEEERRALLRDVDSVYAWFKDDEEVTLILMASEDGLIGAAIQEECGMSKTQYESARKRMRRGVAKMLTDRRKA